MKNETLLLTTLTIAKFDALQNQLQCIFSLTMNSVILINNLM